MWVNHPGCDSFRPTEAFRRFQPHPTFQLQFYERLQARTTQPMCSFLSDTQKLRQWMFTAVFKSLNFEAICYRATDNYHNILTISYHQFSSVTQSCLTLCDSMNHSIPGLPVHHQLPEFTQTHVHWVGDATPPSHPLLSPSPPAFNLSQHQGLFKWVISSRQVAKVLEFQLPHQSFQWTLRTDLL